MGESRGEGSAKAVGTFGGILGAMDEANWIMRGNGGFWVVNG